MGEVVEYDRNYGPNRKAGKKPMDSSYFGNRPSFSLLW